MILPTPEHEETRQRELEEGLRALIPSHGVGIVTTIGAAQSCGCCFNTVVGSVGVLKPEHMDDAVGSMLTCLRISLHRLAPTVDRTPDEVDEWLARKFTQCLSQETSE